MVSLLLFFRKGLKFQPNVCNRCRDVLIRSMNLSDAAILNINGIVNCCLINRISKSKAMGFLNIVNLNEKNGTLYGIKIYYHV